MRDDAADPLTEFRRVNVAGTEHLARQAARAGEAAGVCQQVARIERSGMRGSIWQCSASFPYFAVLHAGYGTAQVERLTGSLRVDSGKIRRELGWTPPYALQQGLQSTAEWYRERGKS